MNGIELRDIVEKAGLQLVICGNGHFQIVGGKFLVNYYPNTRKGQKIYIASTKEGISVNSIEEVIHAANNLPVNLQSEERRANYTKQLKWLFRKGSQCHICLKNVERQDGSVDHIIPLSKGGLNNRNNYALAHKVCNLRKGHST